MTPEGGVKKKVKEYLQSIDAWYYMPVSNGMGRVGCPDILVCYQGMFMAFETKAPGKLGHVTANQQREIIGIQRANGWYPTIWSDLYRALLYYDLSLASALLLRVRLSCSGPSYPLDHMC